MLCLLREREHECEVMYDGFIEAVPWLEIFACEDYRSREWQRIVSMDLMLYTTLLLSSSKDTETSNRGGYVFRNMAQQ